MGKKDSQKEPQKKTVFEVTQKPKRKMSPKSLANLRLWKPGQTGNPRKRIPRTLREVTLLAREYTVDAIERLGEIMLMRNIPAATRAAEALLDRAWGKAPQTISVTGEDGGPVKQTIQVEIPGAAQLSGKVIEVLQKIGAMPRIIEAAAEAAVVKELPESFEEMKG